MFTCFFSVLKYTGLAGCRSQTGWFNMFCAEKMTVDRVGTEQCENTHTHQPVRVTGNVLLMSEVRELTVYSHHPLQIR